MKGRVLEKNPGSVGPKVGPESRVITQTSSHGGIVDFFRLWTLDY